MFSNYTPQGGFDEYFAAPNQPRSCFEPLISSLGHLGLEEISRSHRAAETLLQQVGATFQLYSGDTDSGERILPFDPLPRLITAGDWAWLEAGLIQRLQAIDLFLGDIYGDQHIINDGVIPREYIETSQGWRPAMVGITPPLERWCHVAGLDLIRDEEGAWKVLEDNLRCPSGVAYYLENRRVMKRMFPSLFHSRTVQAIDDYPSYLLQTLQDLAPWTETPKVVVLTPGSFNSAYFEHSYLAQQMGVELVEGRDLFCEDGRVWLNSTNGSQIVDVIYRRIDDEFLDPACFRPDSLLGVRGLMDVYR
ncbi:MAG: circularly permuted type 2 ATP-grasp protein, partial [Synechococcus sp. SB0676_bin_10]|nr:circularly permuted type 2 ATP-grasp protein [Synechococcus sp. SB0676_bin_10]